VLRLPPSVPGRSSPRDRVPPQRHLGVRYSWKERRILPAARDLVIRPHTGTCFVGGDGRVSQVPGGSVRAHAPLHDLGRVSPARPSRQVVGAFRTFQAVGCSATVHFGARSRGLRTRCLRFAAGVSSEPRKTRYRLVGQPWPGGIGYPLDPKRGFSVTSRHVIPLDQAWPGARKAGNSGNGRDRMELLLPFLHFLYFLPSSALLLLGSRRLPLLFSPCPFTPGSSRRRART